MKDRIPRFLQLLMINETKKSILCARCRISIIRLVEKKNFFSLNQKSVAIDSFFLTGQEKKSLSYS